MQRRARLSSKQKIRVRFSGDVRRSQETTAITGNNYGALEERLTRLALNQEIAGSNPARVTMLIRSHQGPIFYGLGSSPFKRWNGVRVSVGLPRSGLELVPAGPHSSCNAGWLLTS